MAIGLLNRIARATSVPAARGRFRHRRAAGKPGRYVSDSESWSPRRHVLVQLDHRLRRRGALTFREECVRQPESRSVQFSLLPDGRWIACTRRPQEEQLPSVYVEPFSQAGGDELAQGQSPSTVVAGWKTPVLFLAGISPARCRECRHQPTFHLHAPTLMPGALALSAEVEPRHRAGRQTLHPRRPGWPVHHCVQ